MSRDPASRLYRAILDAQPRPSDSIRLATVTGGTATTVTVRFDGEAAASTKPYRKTYAPAFGGDRVIMLGVGNSWVAIGRIPDSNTNSPDTGWITPIMGNGWVSYDGGSSWENPGYRRQNGKTELRGLIRTGTTTDGTVIFTLPVGFRPDSNKHISVASANAFGVLKVFSNGQVACGTPLNQAWVSLANISFPADL